MEASMKKLKAGPAGARLIVIVPPTPRQFASIAGDIALVAELNALSVLMVLARLG